MNRLGVLLIISCACSACASACLANWLIFPIGMIDIFSRLVVVICQSPRCELSDKQPAAQNHWSEQDMVEYLSTLRGE